MYTFVREVVMTTTEDEIPDRLKDIYGTENILVIGRAEELPQKSIASVVILRKPFYDRRDRMLWNKWYESHNCVAVHLKGSLVIFFDKKLQKQFYTIRN